MKNTGIITFSITLVFVLTAFSTRAVCDEDVHLHGYGELHYGNTNKPGSTDRMDNHRLVLGWSHSFTDRIRFNAEIDFEHAAKEMELEFAFVDFLITPSFNVRAGSMLMPVGYMNEFHEPPLFNSVERPYVQKNIIPTSWQEGGVGVFGRLAYSVRYRAYLVNGLDASQFKAGSGIRSGRHKVAESPSESMAVVGRVEHYGVEGLKLGLSGYRGNSGQGVDGIGDAPVTLIEADVRYSIKGIDLTGLFSQVNIGDTEKIHSVSGQTIGEKLTGSYVEAAYHAGKLFMPDDQDIVVFARHELFNTQAEVASGLSADPANDQTVTTLGVAYFPTPKVAVKCDIENWENDKGDSWEQINFGLGYMY